jgi:uncharacterized membrane protein
MKFYTKISSESDVIPSVFYLMTSHHPPCQLNRTIRLSIIGHKIFLCSRCLAQNIGLVVSLWAIVTFRIHITDIIHSVFLFGLLPLPVTVDWFSQTMGNRESNNIIRVITGFLFGISLGVSISVIIHVNIFATLIMIVSYLFYLTIVMSRLRKLKLINAYISPYQSFLASYEKIKGFDN